MRRQILPIVLVVVFVMATGASAAPNASAPGHLVPEFETLPTINGQAVQGANLTATAGTSKGPSSDYSFQWVRCNATGAACAAIARATLQTYALTAADVSTTLRVAVTATNKNGSTVATSDASPVVATLTASSPGTTTTSGTSTSSSTTTTTTATTTTTTTTTTPTTTTISPPPSGTILERKTWEEGVVDSTGWGHQCGDNTSDSITRGTVTIDGSIFDSGAKSGRFDVPASSGKQACQMITAPFRKVNEERSDYYSFALRASGIPPQFVHENLYDLNYYGLNAMPYGVAVSYTGGLILMLNTGYCTPETGCEHYSGYDNYSGYRGRGAFVDGPYYLVPPGQFVLNQWYEGIVHVYNTVNNTGVVEAWIRPKGGTFTKVVDKHGGFPTLQWGYSINAQRWYTPNQIAGLDSVDKWGLYRNGGVPYSATVWNDNFCRATTFSAAASCFS